MKKTFSTNNMSKAVEIVLGVIEHMNLTNSEKLALIEELNDTTTSKITLKPMTEKEIYQRKFEKWIVEKKILYPPPKY